MAGRPRRVFAVASHPDDIEFMMAGTMLLLRERGWELHVMNVANGSMGTAQHDRDEIVAIRREEARNSARLLGAVFHDSLVDDLAVFYERETLARLASVMREVAPEILLTHYPFDYMEDHSNTCRLAVTAAFSRGMRNFRTEPPRPPVEQELFVYHAMPHSLRDPLGRPVKADFFVDAGPVMDLKAGLLAEHKSQKDWLDKSQGMDSYLITMRDMCRSMGRESGRFEFAEGWIRHLHYGFSAKSGDPLARELSGRVTAQEE